MLDKIMELVGGDALNEMVGKAGISMDQAKEMLPLAQESLEEGLMPEVTGGNTEGLLGLFNSAGGEGLMSNGIFGTIKSLFMGKIMSKLGLPESIAGMVAGSGLSSILGGLAGKMKEDGDNDGIDASNILSVLGGGGAAGILGSVLGGVTGGAEGALGGIKDAAASILGGAKEGGEGALDGIKDVAANLLGGKEEGKEDGGLLDNLKDAAGGLFGK